MDGHLFVDVAPLLFQTVEQGPRDGAEDFLPLYDVALTPIAALFEAPEVHVSSDEEFGFSIQVIGMYAGRSTVLTIFFEPFQDAEARPDPLPPEDD